MSKNALSPEDLRVINDFNEKLGAGLDALERAKQLKEGDYLILKLQDNDGHMKPEVNSYGAPIKYKVVHTTKHGIPFIKKINKRGEPVGHLFTCMGNLETDDYRLRSQKFEFELDSDFADSLLLQDEYDPAQLHKSKKDIWKAVTDHNKANKIPTHNLNDVAAFLGAVNIGNILWRSNISHFLVQDKKVLSRSEFAQYNSPTDTKLFTKVKGPYIVVLAVVDKKGNVFDITADYFLHKALYKERPRTYKELNI